LWGGGNVPRDGLGRKQLKARGKGTLSLRKDWSYGAVNSTAGSLGGMLHRFVRFCSQRLA